tara:strand:+ start:216 stop:494 length:279 start_codon:yes stop_codon:yes gene_type:complete
MSQVFPDSVGLEMGSVSVITTENQGHSPEALAELALDKIIRVGENLPEPIKAQALAYRDDLRRILVFYMRQAMLSAKTTMLAEITEQVKDTK